MAEGGLRRASHVWHDAEDPYLPSPGNWTLPSMAIETAMPEVLRWRRCTPAASATASWQMQRSGLLTATARLVAQGKPLRPQQRLARPPSLALQRFGHFNGAITRNGTPLGNVISAEVTYSNGPRPDRGPSGRTVASKGQTPAWPR